MGMTAIRGSSYSGRVISRLDAWPTLRTGRARCGVGVGVSTGSHEIMHLHSADEADLRLTRPVIERMKDAFEESGQVHADPDGDWVSVRLESDHDVDLLLSLVSVAIQVSAATSQRAADGPDGADGADGSAP